MLSYKNKACYLIIWQHSSQQGKKGLAGIQTWVDLYPRPKLLTPTTPLPNEFQYFFNSKKKVILYAL